MAYVGKDMDTILEQYPAKPEYLIFLLQDIQSSYGYISPESMQQASDYAGVPLTQAYSNTGKPHKVAEAINGWLEMT